MVSLQTLPDIRALYPFIPMSGYTCIHIVNGSTENYPRKYGPGSDSQVPDIHPNLHRGSRCGIDGGVKVFTLMVNKHREQARTVLGQAQLKLNNAKEP